MKRRKYNSNIFQISSKKSLNDCFTKKWSNLSIAVISITKLELSRENHGRKYYVNSTGLQCDDQLKFSTL